MANLVIDYNLKLAFEVARQPRIKVDDVVELEHVPVFLFDFLLVDRLRHERVVQQLFVRDSLLGFLLEHFLEHVLEVVRNGLLGRKLHILRFDQHLQIFDVLAGTRVKRVDAVDHLVDHHAKGPQVSLFSLFVVKQDLGRHCQGRARHAL